VKENLLKQQHKAETIIIETHLSMFAVGAATMKKVSSVCHSIGVTLFVDL
jgi:hypothetical protein